MHILWLVKMAYNPARKYRELSAAAQKMRNLAIDNKVNSVFRKSCDWQYIWL